MAERAAHITSASFTTKPSIFEILAQESLMTTIRPALKHAVKVLAESRPDKFGWMIRWYDEIYTSLDLVLQNFYLRNHCSSFAENFYGIKRVPLSGMSVGDKLPPQIFWKSIVCLALIPYIKHKIDKKFEDMRHRLNIGNISQQSVVGSLSRAFVGVYPYIHMTWEGSVLWYQLAYMFGRGRWHTPFVKLAGVELCHVQEEDLASAVGSLVDWNSASSSERLQYIAERALNLTATSLSTGLSVGVFFLQFLDWWYTSDSNAPMLMSLPVPEAPKCDEDLSTPPYNVCPVCLRTRTNDTALSVSGYVFCYPCIYEYVNKHRCCPVTSYPASQEHLIKLYPPDS
ncbi:peroxisome assembly protein 12-like [Ylistrum balloti]|uniref:peroxisome assembly protein 12-like n=1 Tax=Ylistrum balloti TaxID=509963 RepID=UPI002905E895|nr:peroxisome assembly protein 12-like [Ylistrum balloti]